MVTSPSSISPGINQPSHNTDSSLKDLISSLETIKDSSDLRLPEVLCEITKQGANLQKDLRYQAFLPLFGGRRNDDGSIEINFGGSVCSKFGLSILTAHILKEIRNMTEDVQYEIIDLLLSYLVKIPLMEGRSLAVADFVIGISFLCPGERRKELWLTLSLSELRLLGSSSDTMCSLISRWAVCHILSEIEQDLTGELWPGFLEALRKRLSEEEGARFDDVSLLVLGELKEVQSMMKSTVLDCSRRIQIIECIPECAKQCEHVLSYTKEFILPPLRNLIPLLGTGEKSNDLSSCLQGVLCEIAKQKADDQDFLCGLVLSALLEKCHSDGRETCDLYGLVSYLLTRKEDSKGDEEDLADNGREAFLRHVLEIINSVDSDAALHGREAFLEHMFRHVLKILNSVGSDAALLKDPHMQCSILRCTAACGLLEEELWLNFLGVLQKQWSGVSAGFILSSLEALGETATAVRLGPPQRTQIVESCIPESMQQQGKVLRCMRKFTHPSKRFLPLGQDCRLL